MKRDQDSALCQVCRFNDYFLEVVMEKQNESQFLRMITNTGTLPSTFSRHKTKTNQGILYWTNLPDGLNVTRAFSCS